MSTILLEREDKGREGGPSSSLLKLLAFFILQVELVFLEDMRLRKNDMTRRSPRLPSMWLEAAFESILSHRQSAERMLRAPGQREGKGGGGGRRGGGTR